MQREDPNSEGLTRERTSIIRAFMPAASSVLEFEDSHPGECTILHHANGIIKPNWALAFGAKPQGGSRNGQQLANTREPWLVNQQMLRAEDSLVERSAEKQLKMARLPILAG